MEKTGLSEETLRSFGNLLGYGWKDIYNLTDEELAEAVSMVEQAGEQSDRHKQASDNAAAYVQAFGLEELDGINLEYRGYDGLDESMAEQLLDSVVFADETKKALYGADDYIFEIGESPLCVQVICDYDTLEALGYIPAEAAEG